MIEVAVSNNARLYWGEVESENLDKSSSPPYFSSQAGNLSRSPGALYMIKKVATADPVTNLFCFGALFWWEMAVAIKILLFDELVGPS